MDQPKIERMLRLMKYMSGNVNYTIEQLSGKLEMSPRTIYRYVDTFKSAGFAVTKLYGNVYRLGKLPRNAPDFDRLIYFSEEEAYMVNSLIDRLDPTNNLKVNLKQKLAAIYDSTSIADFVDKRSNAGNVQTLADAIRGRKKVVLKAYESGSSHTVRDRHVEPFGFTTNYIDVWGYDLDDGRNKTFKIARIEEVEVLDEEWTEEGAHCVSGVDVFRMSGTSPERIRLRLGILAKNLLLEEYPLAARDLHKDGDGWILDTLVYGFGGACRFYLGLSHDISILDSPHFVEFVRKYLSDNLSHILDS